MKLKNVALAAVLACGLSSAFGNDQTVNLSSGSALFASQGSVLAGGDDVITFSNLSSGTYNFSLNLGSFNIAGLTASMNGQLASVDSWGLFSWASLSGTSSSPFVLSLTGKPGYFGAYGGSMTASAVSAVPEPETYAMMLAGLALIGSIAVRRNKSKAF